MRRTRCIESLTSPSARCGPPKREPPPHWPSATPPLFGFLTVSLHIIQKSLDLCRIYSRLLSLDRQTPTRGPQLIILLILPAAYTSPLPTNIPTIATTTLGPNYRRADEIVRVAGNEVSNRDARNDSSPDSWGPFSTHTPDVSPKWTAP